MSTHIDYAWLIPTDKLSTLIAVAQQIAKIHRSTIVAEVIDRMRGYFWLEDSIKAVKGLPKYNVLRFFGKVRKVVEAHEHKASYDMPKEVRTELEKEIPTIFEEGITDQNKAHLILIGEDLFETVLLYSGAGLNFLAGESNTTYMVGHALSMHATTWCYKHFVDFHYQNSTDEPLDRFNPSLAKALCEAFVELDCPLNGNQKLYVESVLSSHMQDQRGKAWDRAFAKYTTAAKAGLSYQCLSRDFDSGDIALLAARRLFNLRIPS